MNDYADDVVRRLCAAFEAARDETQAPAMAAYMRNQFPFLGIKSPVRVGLEREALAGVPKPASADLAAVALALWELPEREYQYAACGLLSKHARVLGPEFLPTALELIQSKSWWDTVDTLAAHVVGSIVLRHRQAASVMDAWIEDRDFWVARTALLHQLRFKGQTDAGRLFAYCERRAHDREFFIRKAIGWALREYSKTDGEAVRAFVASHEQRLSGLSKREAMLWLNGGRGKT